MPSRLITYMYIQVVECRGRVSSMSLLHVFDRETAVPKVWKMLFCCCFRLRYFKFKAKHENDSKRVLAVKHSYWFWVSLICFNLRNFISGDTVRDFNAHRFLLGTASPVLHKILFDWGDPDDELDRLLVLDDHFCVTLRLVKCYDYHRLELEGVPPIAAEALLEYIYKD